MRNTILSLADLTLYAGMVCLILLPSLLIFPPFPEASEFMKQASVVFISGLMLTAWLTRTMVLRQLRVTFSLVLPFYIIFVLVIGVSTLFSLDPIASLLTLRSTASPSIVLAGLLACVFMMMTNQLINLSWVMRLMGVMSVTAGLLALTTVWGFAGSPLAITGTLLGSPESTSWVIASTVPLTLALLLTFWLSARKKKGIAAHRLLSWLPPNLITVVFVVLVVLELLFLLIINTPALWLGMGVSTGIFLIFIWNIPSITHYRVPLLVGALMVSTLVLARLWMLPPKLAVSRSPRMTVPIAIRTLYSSPVPLRLLFGSGPATYWHVIVQHQSASETPFTTPSTDQEPHSNTFLYLLTTLGIVGLTAYVFLFVAGLTLILKALHSHPSPRVCLLLIGALGSLLSWFVGGFTALANTSVIVLFISFLALIVALAKVTGASLTKTVVLPLGRQPRASTTTVRGISAALVEILPIVLFILSVLVIMALLFITTRLVGAQVNLGHAHWAMTKGELREAYKSALTAVRLNPYADYTHRTLGIVSLSLSGASSDVAQAQQLAKQAISEARWAVVVGKLDAANWIVLGEVYRSLSSVSPEAKDFAHKAYTEAARLEPANPNLQRTADSLKPTATSPSGDVAGTKDSR